MAASMRRARPVHPGGRARVKVNLTSAPPGYAAMARNSPP
jgi:hypothetical protein